MRSSIFYLSALAALATAAPFGDHRGAPGGGNVPRGGCDVSKLTPPAAPVALPGPPAGSTLKMVVVGTGTQNYTCADGAATTKPAAVGAKATLHDAGCLAVYNQDMLNRLTKAAIRAPPGSLDNLLVVGHHYFSAKDVPTFDLNGLGSNNCKKDTAADAPDPKADVPWLYLTGTSGVAKAVYRVETTAGVAPATCEGKQAGLFTVPYTAQYWVYA